MFARLLRTVQRPAVLDHFDLDETVVVGLVWVLIVCDVLFFGMFVSTEARCSLPSEAEALVGLNVTEVVGELSRLTASHFLTLEYANIECASEIKDRYAATAFATALFVVIGVMFIRISSTYLAALSNGVDQAYAKVMLYEMGEASAGDGEGDEGEDMPTMEKLCRKYMMWKVGILLVLCSVAVYGVVAVASENTADDWLDTFVCVGRSGWIAEGGFGTATLMCATTLGYQIRMLTIVTVVLRVSVILALLYSMFQLHAYARAAAWATLMDDARVVVALRSNPFHAPSRSSLVNSSLSRIVRASLNRITPPMSTADGGHAYAEPPSVRVREAAPSVRMRESAPRPADASVRMRESAPRPADASVRMCESAPRPADASVRMCESSASELASSDGTWESATASPGGAASCGWPATPPPGSDSHDPWRESYFLA